MRVIGGEMHSPVMRGGGGEKEAENRIRMRETFRLKIAINTFTENRVNLLECGVHCRQRVSSPDEFEII